jgi:hypothetical protein
MAHLAQSEKCGHEGKEVNKTIVRRVVHHEVHQHIEAETSNDEQKKTNHKSRRAGLLLM